jgi:hypothetical protein
MNSTLSAGSSLGLTKSNSHVHFFHIPIFILAVLTAAPHLYLAAQPDEELHSAFLLNGLGYLALATAFVLPGFRSFHEPLRWILVGYTSLTIILWFFLGSPAEGTLDPFDLSVKAVELLLVIFLFLDKKREVMNVH